MKKIILLLLLSFNLLPGIKNGSFKWFAQGVMAQNMGEELPDVKVCAHYEEEDLGIVDGWHTVLKCHESIDCTTGDVIDPNCTTSMTYVGNPDDGSGGPGEVGGGGGGGGGGGSTGGGSGSSGGASPAPGRVPININKFMDCFVIDYTQSAQYSIRINVALPNPNNPYDMFTLSGDVGHTFITMEKNSGGQIITQTFGFYPTDALTNLAFFPVSSTIVNNANSGAIHTYDASFTMNNLTAEQFAMLMTSAENNSGQNYDLNDYNCTSYALSVINSIRPDSDPLTSDLRMIPDPWDGGMSNIILPQVQVVCTLPFRH